jgi:hypothetical protein
MATPQPNTPAQVGVNETPATPPVAQGNTAGLTEAQIRAGWYVLDSGVPVPPLSDEQIAAGAKYSDDGSMIFPDGTVLPPLKVASNNEDRSYLFTWGEGPALNPVPFGQDSPAGYVEKIPNPTAEEIARGKTLDAEVASEGYVDDRDDYDFYIQEYLPFVKYQEELEKQAANIAAGRPATAIVIPEIGLDSIDIFGTPVWMGEKKTSIESKLGAPDRTVQTTYDTGYVYNFEDGFISFSYGVNGRLMNITSEALGWSYEGRSIGGVANESAPLREGEYWGGTSGWRGISGVKSCPTTSDNYADMYGAAGTLDVVWSKHDGSAVFNRIGVSLSQEDIYGYNWTKDRQ